MTFLNIVYLFFHIVKVSSEIPSRRNEHSDAESEPGVARREGVGDRVKQAQGREGSAGDTVRATGTPARCRVRARLPEGPRRKQHGASRHCAARWEPTEC